MLLASFVISVYVSGVGRKGRPLKYQLSTYSQADSWETFVTLLVIHLPKYCRSASNRDNILLCRYCEQQLRACAFGVINFYFSFICFFQKIK